MFELRRRKGSWRFYFRGRHVHHGLDGLVLIVFGIALVAHDWADRWWVPRHD